MNNSGRTFIYDISFNHLGTSYNLRKDNVVSITKNSIIDIFIFCSFDISIGDKFIIFSNGSKGYFSILNISKVKIQKVVNSVIIYIDLFKINAEKIDSGNMNLNLNESIIEIQNLDINYTNLDENKNVLIYDPVTGKQYYHIIEKDSSTPSPSNIFFFDTSDNKIKYSSNKTFVIDHPIRDDKYLVHACLEGPEAGVYYRGQSKIEECGHVDIYLPEYVSHIARDFTVLVTAVVDINWTYDKTLPSLVVSDVIENKFRVFGPSDTKFNWQVSGKRDSIDVEPLKRKVLLNGNGPYRWIT
jgi:hypothetical protein